MHDLKTLSEELDIEDRKVLWLERLLIFALFLLIAYAVHRIYHNSWTDLLSISIPFAASLSALLVAATATRLIKFNQIQKGREDHEERRREIQNAIIVLDEIRGRLHYIKECHVDKTKPLVGIQKAIEEIENLYRNFLSKEGTGLLPPNSSEVIYKLSGSIFGLSVGIARVVAFHKNKPETTIFFGDIAEAPEAVKLIEDMDLLMDKATKSLDEHYQVLADAMRS